MSSSKVHPIYVALESHQYNRAIKLCLAQPKDHTLAQALLAHAYAKSNQRYKALLTIQGILGTDGFPELQLEIKYSVEGRQQQQQARAAATAAPTTTSSSKKGGKKGKRKGAAPSPAAVPPPPPPTDQYKDWDLIDQLDQPPVLPDDWDRLPGASNALTDHTILSTLAMTMVNSLKLPLTAYQLYCWAVSKAENDEVLLRCAFTHGLGVLVAPHYAALSTPILANLQVLALQLARVQQHLYGISPATAWAAQAALWQLDYQTENQNDPKQEQRLAMLPRLAESLASKCVQQQMTGTPREVLVNTENFMLYMRTLNIQSKWAEKLAALEDRLSQGGDHMAPPRTKILDYKSDVLQKLGRYTEALAVLEDELLQTYPDDWSYWKRHIECSLGEADGDTSGFGRTEQMTEKILAQAETNGQEYPLRGPQLVKVEIAAEQLKRSSGAVGRVDKLVERIIEYGDIFSARASCIFSDLTPYLDLVLQHSSEDNALVLLKWLSESLVKPSSEDTKERRRQLRQYIFAVQVNYRILLQYPNLREQWIPEWKDLVKVWRQYQGFENADQAQKESRPADDLIILATQQILYGEPCDSDLLVAAALLESAIQYSPYNAYLKMSTMFVYAQLNAVARSWDLFRDLYIKHIQYESCAYIILPLLQFGGFYQEGISVCQEILRLQTSAAREACEYTGRAVENGTLSKADEFIAFHRDRMSKSLTTLEAKGLVLDFAPMFRHDDKQATLGAVHGVVGGDSDLERVKQMIAEAHNPYAAFSLLRLKGSVGENVDNFCENRDFSILDHEIILQREFDSKERVVSDSIRRGHHHSLLIRGTLCVDATKGPKKGKISKASDELQRRCTSLLTSVDAALRDCDTDDQESGHRKLLHAMADMSRTIAVVSGGIVAGSVPADDTLERREERAANFLSRISNGLKDSREQLALDQGSFRRISCLLPDCIVPLFALFQMCGKVLEMFGWGRRKRKSRPCAAALADVSLVFVSLIDDMNSILKSLPDPVVLSGEDRSELVPDLLDSTVLSETALLVVRSQQESRDRVQAIVDEVKEALNKFNVDEQ